MFLEDHFSLPIFKISRLLHKITGLQVTSPDMDGRESEIPISFKLATYLKAASEHLNVAAVLMFITPKRYVSFQELITYFSSLQVNIYTPAGFICPHYDSHPINFENIAEGHRIATALFYVR